MNKAVFFDRDGTINVDGHYIGRAEDFEYLPGVLEAMRILETAGYLLIVITNQSGIARGYFTEDDYKQLDQWMKEDLAKQQVCLTASYYCPHLPEAAIPKYKSVCTCRKPGMELFRQAAREHEIDLSASYVIGDRLRDLPTSGLGCRGFLVGHSEREDVILAVKEGMYWGISHKENLGECALEICAIESRNGWARTYCRPQAESRSCPSSSS